MQKKKKFYIPFLTFYQNRVIFPYFEKDIWDHWGYLEIEADDFDDACKNFTNDKKVCDYILYPELTSNQVFKIIQGE